MHIDANAMSQSPLPGVSRWLSRVLCVSALALLAGCVVTEQRTIVVLVPRHTNTIEVYTVFEGVSVLEKNKEYKSDDAEALILARWHLRDLRHDNANFMVGDLFFSTKKPEVGLVPNEFLGPTKLLPLRFYLDPARQRQLCADRHLTIQNRTAAEKSINKIMDEGLAFNGRTPKEILKDMPELRDLLMNPKILEFIDEYGWGPLIHPARGLLLLTTQLDIDSIERMQVAAKKGFRWVRFEPEGIRIVFPVTKDCARRMAEGAETKKLLKEVERFVRPVAIEAMAEGIAVVLGTKDEPVRFSYINKQAYRKGLEKDLIREAGNPKVMMIDGRPVNAARLIQRFIAESTKKP